ncbi:hypothetical protein [Bacillus sp. JCM 19041]|uniref:hypothetical protein n=1 Tax=Bacillus sp. JCM 19041 TaxID=1460637 RepID=UPI0006D2B7F2
MDVDELVGTWEMFCFEPLRDEVEQPLVMEIGVKVAVIGDANYLIEENNGEFCFVKDSHCMKMQALCAWDWESNKQTAVLMGLDNEGVVFSAKRLF